MSDWAAIRGDADALPSDPNNMRFRPYGVSFAGILVLLAAAWQVVIGVFVILTAISSSQAERFFKGQYLGSVSDGYLWFYGLLSLTFAALLFWLSRSLKDGDPTARFVVIILAALEIVFALFSFPWGVGTAVLSIALICALSTTKSRRWFEGSGYEVSRASSFL